MNVIVLGAGLVGGPMAVDLAAEGEFEVAVADVSQGALEKVAARSPGIRTIRKDLSDPEGVRALVSVFDMVLNAVPGFMGFETLRAIIEAGKDVVDIAFFPEDPFGLDGLAKEHGVTAIVDCGVAPGMSNILTGYADHLLDQTETCITHVGGLPEERKWPYEYKAVFSPIDVIEEYTRPARFVEKGELVVKPALSDPELIEFPEVGTLEAFNSDGLRTMINTIEAPNKKEKTLRYPGHIEKMAMLRETGFFSREEIEINGVWIRPVDLTTKLLFPLWKLEEGEADITVMKVVVEGIKDGKPKRYVYDLFDRYDEKTRTHSMARVTGYTATMALRMVAKGLFAQEGIVAPEFIGREPGCVEFLLDGLKERGVVYKG